MKKRWSRFAGVVLAVTQLGGVAAAETARDAAEKLARSGDDYAKRGDAKLAVMAFRRAIERDPTYPPPYGGIGFLLFTAGEKPEALKYFEKYLAIEKRESEAASVARVKRVVEQILGGAKRAMMPATASASASAPATAPASAPASASATASAAAPAREDFNAKAPRRKDAKSEASSLGDSASLRLSPLPAAAPASSTRDADQLFRRRDFTAAAAAYRKLAESSPRAVEPRFKLAAALTALARWKEALAAWDAVLKLDAKNDAARLYRERVAEKSAKVTEVAALATDAAMKHADEALHEGTPSLVLGLTEGVLATAPDRVDALILRARALAALARFDEAVTAVRRALARNPGDPRAHFALGETHRILGERDKARAAFERFLTIVDAADASLARDIAFARRYIEKRP